MTSDHGGHGKLFVVGTPIGNLQDITLRAVDTLKHVEVVVAEDTRRTRGLLSHLGITGKQVLSVDANADSGRIAHVVAMLQGGRSAALVTDAGMPSVSDPGAELVRAVREQDMVVEVIPGASAVTAAIALSGLVDGPFLFLGFLPRKGKGRRDALSLVCKTDAAVVLFESPNRLRPTLLELAQAQPERTACVCRELTKVHEATHLGSLAQLAQAEITERGEFTLVLGPFSSAVDAPTPESLIPDIDAMLEAGSSVRDVATELAQQSGLSRRVIFQLALTRRGKDT